MGIVKHFGDEGLLTYILAERALGKGHQVTFVGKGPSMEPVIPHNTRMWWEPYESQHIAPGMPLFCRFSLKHFSCHMAWIVTDKHILIGTSGGYMEGWVKRDQILGIYKGDWAN